MTLSIERPAASSAGEYFDQRFRLEDLLGRGAEAEVHRATDLRTGKQVALKIYHGPGNRNDRCREVLIHGGLRHRHIVALYDRGPAGHPSLPAYAVLELVEGTTLQGILRAGPVESGLAASWYRGLLKALAHVHARGIVHHDIKPSNILIPRGRDGRPSGTAKLADFGIASSPCLPCDSPGYGTAHYMSPEQAAGGIPGTAGDVYALGLVILESLTGAKPFPASPIPSMVARTRHVPRIPDTVPRQWAELIAAMTTIDPAHRATAREALRLLRRVRRGTAQ
ncbi:serine/threonine-protein kinase [Arthrobacter sp. USHLN218]|uniref:serine/threonine-protein kinase n=1 Tax=Arthrobacter sp. USHLN218 TaxID=3081232 RepID=UPI00301B5E22